MAVISRCPDAADATERLPHGGGFGGQDGPSRHVVVPFDQGRKRPGARDDALVKTPYGSGNPAAVGIDQKRGAAVVALLIVPTEMNFPDVLQREFGQIFVRIGP